MLNHAAFILEYPEFTSVDAALVTTVLARAEASIDAAVWGDLEDQGHGLLTAHELAMMPFGAQAGLRAGAGANQVSIYWGRYDDLRRRVGTAYRMVLP